jgi:hypothetical protein
MSCLSAFELSRAADLLASDGPRTVTVDLQRPWENMTFSHPLLWSHSNKKQAMSSSLHRSPQRPSQARSPHILRFLVSGVSLSC